MTTGRINQVATLHGTRARAEHLPKEDTSTHTHTPCGAGHRSAPNRWESVPECASIQAPGPGQAPNEAPLPKSLSLAATSTGTSGDEPRNQRTEPERFAEGRLQTGRQGRSRDNTVNKRTKQTRTRARPPPGHAVAWATEPACPSKGASCPERTHSNLCRHTTSHRVSGQTRIIARRTLRNARRPRTLAAPVSKRGDKGSREHVALIRATRARRLGAPQGHTEDSEPTSHGGRSSGYLAPDMPPLRRKGTLRTTV